MILNYNSLFFPFFHKAVFGPTDDALVAAGVSGPSDLPQATLLRHAVLGTYTAATLTASTCQEITSVPGDKLVVETRLDGSITVNGGT